MSNRLRNSEWFPTEIHKVLGFDKWLKFSLGYSKIESEAVVERLAASLGRGGGKVVPEERRVCPSDCGNHPVITMNDHFIQIKQCGGADDEGSQSVRMSWCDRCCHVGHSDYCREISDLHRPLKQNLSMPKKSPRRAPPRPPSFRIKLEPKSGRQSAFSPVKSPIIPPAVLTYNRGKVAAAEV